MRSRTQCQLLFRLGLSRIYFVCSEPTHISTVLPSKRAYLVAKKNSFSHVQFIKLQIFSNEKLFSIFSTCVSFMLMICVMQTTYLSLSQSNRSKRLRFSFFFYWKDILTHISLFFNLVVKKPKIREEDNVERVYICQIMSARRVYRSKSKL